MGKNYNINEWFQIQCYLKSHIYIDEGVRAIIKREHACMDHQKRNNNRLAKAKFHIDPESFWRNYSYVRLLLSVKSSYSVIIININFHC